MGEKITKTPQTDQTPEEEKDSWLDAENSDSLSFLCDDDDNKEGFTR